jgi:hypothetical protein
MANELEQNLDGKCRIASGSERMQALNVESAGRSYFIVDRSIRALPRAVLHWTRFEFKA